MSSLPIDSQRLAEFFDQDYRLVNEHEFRRAIFKDGVHDDARQIVWKFLFQFYPFSSTNREREILDLDRFVEYQVMKNRWNQIVRTEELSPPIDFGLKIEINCDRYGPTKSTQSVAQTPNSNSSANIEYMKFQSIVKVSRANISCTNLNEDMKLIDKDLDRTGYLHEVADDESLNDQEKSSIRTALRNLLVTFAAFNQSVVEVYGEKENSVSNLGYTQGMNELASVFVKVFHSEYEAYWCFSNFMLLDTYSTSSIALNMSDIASSHVLKTNVAYYFSDTGMWKKLNHLGYLLSVTDPDLFAKLEKHEMNNLMFCHEWLLLGFKRSFAKTQDFFKCFEALNSRFIELHNSVLKGINVKSLYTFDLFVCLSLLKQVRERFLTECECETDFFDVFASLNRNQVLAQNYDAVITEAERIFDQYCIISHTVSDLKEEQTSTFEKLRNYFFF